MRGITGTRWRGVVTGLIVGFAWCMPQGLANDAVPMAAEPAEPKLTGQLALDETVFPGLKHTISLDLRGMDALEVIKFFATQGQLNIVTSPEVQGRVTLVLTDVTVRDALDIVLVSSGLAVERRGKILYVMSGQLYEQLYGLRYSDPRQPLMIQLKYANADQVGQMLGNIKSPVGRIVIDPQTATLAILDVPSVLVQMQSLIDSVDIATIERQLPTETKVFILQYGTAEDVAPNIQTALTPEVGKIRVDKRSNSLVITDLPARFPEVQKLIAAFDTRHREVFIEASVLQVTLKDNFDTGINWDWLSESKSLSNLHAVNALPIAADASNALQLVIGSATGDDITSTIKALQDFGDTEILSTPHIAVMNNEEAKILVGRREAYVTSTTTQAQTTATTAESVQFVDVGVKLYVTPTISENGFVTLKIRPEVSTKVDTLTTPSKNIIPIVETSEAETHVMVKDGKTIVIGGLMKEETVLSKQKVPLLGDIPIIKVLFSNRSDRIKKTELVILLTPHIITGEEYFAPSSAVTADWRPSTTRTVRP